MPKRPDLYCFFYCAALHVRETPAVAGAVRNGKAARHHDAAEWLVRAIRPRAIDA